MNIYLMLFVGTLTLLDGVSPSKDNRDIDDRLNFIEPTLDLWLWPDGRPKGKSQYKNVLESHGKKKSHWEKSQEGKIATRLPTTTMRSNKDATTRAGEIPPVEYTMPQSLHDHENKRKYHHSIMNGWTF